MKEQEISDLLNAQLEKLDLNKYRLAQRLTALKGQEPAQNRNYSLVCRAFENPYSVEVGSLHQICELLGLTIYVVENIVIRKSKNDKQY